MLNIVVVAPDLLQADGLGSMVSWVLPDSVKGRHTDLESALSQAATLENPIIVVIESSLSETEFSRIEAANGRDPVSVVVIGTSERWQRPGGAVVATVNPRMGSLDLLRALMTVATCAGQGQASGVASIKPSAAAGAPSSGEPSSLPSIKSTRLKETARLLEEGHPNAEIARILGYSEMQVRSYVYRLMKQFDCRNRTQLALLLNKRRETEVTPS